VLRSRWLAGLGMAFVTLVAVSRMYLGRHFLADVLGGFLLGLAVVTALGFVLRSEPAQRLLRAGRIPTGWTGRRKGGVVAVFVLLPILLLALANDPDAFDSVGRLLAVNTAFAILFWQGLPAERNTAVRRGARVGLALLLYLGTSEVTTTLIALAGAKDTALGEFAIGFVPPLAFLLGTVWLGARLGLYTRSDGAAERPAMQPACP
jgi:hypothetical protein